MKKYFYIIDAKQFGPFTLEELGNQKISRNTKIWYFGLEDWKELSEIEELAIVTKALPPELQVSMKLTAKTEYKKEAPSKPKQTKSWKKIRIWGVAIGVVFLVGALVFSLPPNQEEQELYNKISASAYDGDSDFQLYIEKFYRDAEVYGLYPQKPKTTIVKFAKLDQLENTTHYHGVSFGYEDDDRIEIYINPSTWKKFNKPMRYFLMYHELAHDVLNVDDLEYDISDKGKLMFPEVASYELLGMDQFIESAHEMFEEESGNSL